MPVVQPIQVRTRTTVVRAEGNADPENTPRPRLVKAEGLAAATTIFTGGAGNPS